MWSSTSIQVVTSVARSLNHKLILSKLSFFHSRSYVFNIRDYLTGHIEMKKPRYPTEESKVLTDLQTSLAACDNESKLKNLFEQSEFKNLINDHSDLMIYKEPITQEKIPLTWFEFKTQIESLMAHKAQPQRPGIY